jgi:3-dehydroquinate synthase
MQTVTVKLKDFSYPVYMGHHILGMKELYHSKIVGKQVMVVTNTTVAPLYLRALKDSLKSAVNDLQVDEVIIPDGEQYKSLDTMNHIVSTLLSKNHTRSTTLIALGGGVVGDLTGFTAACYKRGVPYIHVPTTLLAQVDSSIGGKTAVNHPLGKNMIGAFYQPQCVIADTAVLKSLSSRDFRAGLAEIIKYSLIQDAKFFDWLTRHMPELLSKSSAVLGEAINRSCEIKSAIVTLDEKELGIRAILNFGHTMGHAIEAFYGFDQWLHGEAVAVGIIVAAQISQAVGMISHENVAQIQQLCRIAGLPTELPPECDWTAVKEFLERDKKVVDNSVRWILLEAIGKAVINQEVPLEIVKSSIHLHQQL